MWLLSTDRAELYYFHSPESVGGYAILSHVWGAREQTFQETQALKEACTASGENPRDRSSEKIRNFCMFAERHGFKWGWADTCCIDKTSSTELSEAINSMFTYYSLAEVCYAYLKDVPTNTIPRVGNNEHPFYHSQWHRRGWTLQELLAPEGVVFISSDWRSIGTKAVMAEYLEVVTGVPKAVLRMEQELEEICVAARMSWASSRKTTRIEDEAYCLMGIFGVNMPTLYGEGRHAFQRLQEEIMKRSTDTSLFAWGLPADRQERSQIGPSRETAIHSHPDDSYLLAPAPSAFRHSRDVEFNPPWKTAPDMRLVNKPSAVLRTLGKAFLSPDRLASVRPSTAIPTITMTPHGALARIPIIKVHDRLIIVLFCTSGYFKAQLGLILTPCIESTAPTGRLYDVGVTVFRERQPLTGGEHFLARLCYLDGPTVPRLWSLDLKETYIRVQRPRAVSSVPTNCGLHSHLQFPLWNLRTLGGRILAIPAMPQGNPRRWTGWPPASFLCYGNPYNHTLPFIIHLGRCRSADGPHWANVVRSNAESGNGWEADSPPEAWKHRCDVDHLGDWPERRAKFSTERWRTFSVHFPKRESVDYDLRRSDSFLYIRLTFTPNDLIGGTASLNEELAARDQAARDDKVLTLHAAVMDRPPLGELFTPSPEP